MDTQCPHLIETGTARSDDNEFTIVRCRLVEDMVGWPVAHGDAKCQDCKNEGEFTSAEESDTLRGLCCRALESRIVLFNIDDGYDGVTAEDAAAKYEKVGRTKDKKHLQKAILKAVDRKLPGERAKLIARTAKVDQ